MAKSKKYSVEALSQLAPDILAQLVSEAVDRDRPLKLATEAALARAKSPDTWAGLLTKRLTSLTGSKARISWKRIKTFAGEVEAWLDQVAELKAQAPALAADLLWTLLAQREQLHSRYDFQSDVLDPVMDRALGDLAMMPAEQSARLDLFKQALGCARDPLSQRLVPGLADKFSTAELEQLAATNAARKPQVRQIWVKLGNPLELERSYTSKELNEPEVQALLSEAWLEAGDRSRAEAVLIDTPANRINRAWRRAQLALLQEGGDEEALREGLLALFKQSLTPEDLKTYIARFPDFDDEEAQEEALDWAEKKGSLLKACRLFVALGDRPRAARAIVNRSDEVKGAYRRDYLEIADVLQDKHPLAAALIFRKFVEIAVSLSNAYDYKEAALYFLGLADMDRYIDDYEGHATHTVFADYMRSEYRLSHSFWDWVIDPATGPAKRARKPRRRRG